MGRAKYFILLLAVLAIASCETTELHKPLVKLPSAAMAPAPVKVAVAPPPSAPKTPPKPVNPSKITAISQLIDRAEADYTAGVEDYQNGDFEKARQEFDQSLGVLLTSPYDIRSDKRLSQEFDLLADHINSAEVIAFQQGNSLSAHQYQPTPIESFSGLTFPVDPNVARRVQEEVKSVHLDIPLISNETVSGIIAYFQNHARGYIQHVLKGIDEYGPMISTALSQQGLPHDLLYLPGPESGFNPHATSRKGAKGLWQLMRSTAELHGLKDNRWIDEREDPYRSTQAAAVDLKSLYKEFGDWYLALAAYDSGPLTVQHAIQETGYADYWKLRALHVLPPETENYVPLFLATALIAKDPQAYGFSPVGAPPIKAERVAVPEPVDLRLAAGLIGQPVDTLVSLNPGLKGYETPSGDPSFRLNLPLGTKDLFEKEIALVPASQRLWWRAAPLQSGETMADFARRFRVAPAALVMANHITTDDPPSPGSTLLIPLAPVRTRMASGVRYARRRYYYRVRRGDNLDLIADRFNVSPYQIRRWNHLRSSRLVSGRRLLVYRLVAVSSRPSTYRHYRRLVHHHRRRTTAAIRE
ncbi:MAG: transglycosylase SLT domain-containing protein [Acidobacteriota bacterium]|nr:transglycosylase SLT domain-containing protein [Acidobacteriota bacterium]